MRNLIYKSSTKFKCLIHSNLCQFGVMLIIILCIQVSPSKGADLWEILFNPEETPSVTYYVSGTNQTYATKYATFRLSRNPFSYGVWGYLNGVMRWDWEDVSGGARIRFGTWYLAQTGAKCGDGADYHCPQIRFEPNSTNINAINLGDTVRVRLYYRLKNPYTEFKDADIFYIRTNLKFDWRSTSTGKDSNQTINNDTFSEQYADLRIVASNDSDLNLKLKLTDGTNQPTEHVLTKAEKLSNWPGQEWYYKSPYGEWFVRSLENCTSEYYKGFKCSTVFFKPDRAALDDVYGRNITMNIIATRSGGGTTDTESIQYDFRGHPETSFEWDNEGSETIVTGNQLEFNDIPGIATIFKLKESAYTFDAIERLDQSTQLLGSVGGTSELIGDFSAKPIGLNFKYGKWFLEETFTGVEDSHDELFHSGDLKFIFRPNTSAITSILNTDENIISSLNFYIHQGDDSTPKITTTTITVTIDRNAVKPILTITSKSNSIIEGNTAKFTITSNVDPMQPFLVSYIPTNSKGDFLNSTTFPSGLPQFENLIFNQAEGSDDWTDEIEIDLRDADGIDADDGSITVTLNTATDYAFYFAAAEPDNSVTIMVKDAEYPTLSFVENTYSTTEEDTDTNLELTLNLSEAIDEAVVVSYSIIEETAIGGTDFVDITNGSVSFLPNTTSTPINIQIKGDDLSEEDETFKVIISAPPSNAYFFQGISTLEAEVTIVDDEPIIMDVATTDFNVAEDVVNGYFIVDVELTKPVGAAPPNAPTPTPVSFLVETSSNGTAIKDVDFKTPERHSTVPRFEFPPDSKTYSFAVPILNDVENEGNETFNLRIHDLQQATFADGTTEHSLELTIIDNEKPTLSFMQDTKTVEEEDSNTNVELTLNLSGPIEEAVDISYELISESATEGTDFVDNGNGVVSIAFNTTSIPISIQIKGDIINEGDETFKVRITTPPSNAVFASGISMLEATITITDDESPTLSVDSSTLTISERAGMTHIGLTLSGPTNEDVVVTYSTSITGNDTAQQADFSTQSASTITIAASPPPATPTTFGLIQIPIINDTDEENNETFTLKLTGVTGAVFAGDQSSIVVQVTIIDDEGLPTLSIDSSEIAVNEQSGYAEIGLSFTPAITEPVTIIYSTIQRTAVGGVDYTMQTNTTIEILTGSNETIFIPIINDNIYEGKEEFFMEISVISGAAYGSVVLNTPIKITITDDETEPTLTISAYSCDYGEPIPTNFSINESIGNLIFNAKLSHPSQDPVTFNYSATIDSPIQADSAISADFYVSSAIQYTIQPGSICTEIVTPITHDELVEEDEQFNVTFTTNTGASIIPTFKVKIEDDDVALWNIEDLTMNEGDSNTEMAFRVYLSTPVHETVRAKWTASTAIGNTATFGEDYAPDHNSYTGYVRILAGQIENFINGLEITGDTIFEPDETFNVFLSDPDDGTQIGDGVAIGTIINDDPEPVLSISTIGQVSGN